MLPRTTKANNSPEHAPPAAALDTRFPGKPKEMPKVRSELGYF